MPDTLRDPIAYPNWVWLLGAALLVVAVTWVVGLLIAYRFSGRPQQARLRPLSEARQDRYERLLSQIRYEHENGTLSTRDAHLALGALIRSAASERLGTNVESASVQMAREKHGRWPLLAEALAWCELPSFGLLPETRADGIDVGFDYALQVVGE